MIAPDSYKGSLSALQVAQAMERGIHRADPNAHTNILPMADGGEGTVDALITAMKGTIIPKTVTGPLGQPVDAFYGLSLDEKTAIIEMSAASGLPLVPEGERNPLLTTSYGTGELIRAALDRGCTQLIIGVGGSATNDGGVGMAQALGYRFLNSDGQELPLGGGFLTDLAIVETTNRHTDLDGVEIIVACDVETVLLGMNGATAVFGPQKGATPDMVVQLDQGLSRLADIIYKTKNMSIGSIPGGGAAGGLGAGLVAFTGATIRKGIEIVLDVSEFDRWVQEVDVVITGEGNTDFQTAMGKTPIGVAKRAKQFNKPVICISGGLGIGYPSIYDHGIDAAFSIIPKPASLHDCFQNGVAWIEDAVESIIRLYLMKK